MKTIILFCFLLVSSSAICAEYILHAAQGVGLIDVNWDSWHWEVTYGVDNGAWAGEADAWFMCDDNGPNYVQQGATCTAFVPDGLQGEFWGWSYAPEFLQTLTSRTVPPDGGEFWLDFDPEGPRVSPTQPADFGKWAWDGSVNPSWVEPLAKKSHGKGHK